MSKDTIYRNDAITAVNIGAFSARTIYGRTDEGSTALHETIRAIKALPPAEPQWIPCSERLPYAEYGESDTVLTTCGYRDVEDTSVRWIRLLYFNGGNWCYPTGETYEAKVYAWMSFPEPYQGGEQDE